MGIWRKTRVAREECGEVVVGRMKRSLHDGVGRIGRVGLVYRFTNSMAYAFRIASNPRASLILIHANRAGKYFLPELVT